MCGIIIGLFPWAEKDAIDERTRPYENGKDL